MSEQVNNTKDLHMETLPAETHYRLVPFWLRTCAHIIDFVIFNGVTYMLDLGGEAFYYGMIKAMGRTNLDLNSALSFVEMTTIDVLVTLVFAYYYYVMPHARGGQTLAKKILKIEVIVVATGQHMTLKQSFIRAFGYLLSYLPFGCGFLMPLFNEKKQALHDYLVGTITIRSEA